MELRPANPANDLWISLQRDGKFQRILIASISYFSPCTIWTQHWQITGDGNELKALKCNPSPPTRESFSAVPLSSPSSACYLVRFAGSSTSRRTSIECKDIKGWFMRSTPLDPELFLISKQIQYYNSSYGGLRVETLWSDFASILQSGRRACWYAHSNMTNYQPSLPLGEAKQCHDSKETLPTNNENTTPLIYTA